MELTDQRDDVLWVARVPQPGHDSPKSVDCPASSMRRYEMPVAEAMNRSEAKSENVTDLSRLLMTMQTDVGR